MQPGRAAKSAYHFRCKLAAKRINFALLVNLA